ncbi:MAG TPA: Scr1 family TA system antitoxin-like transcriptional regulator, partial [Pseudonocardiaceae bacterium]|nr:Scr1 family TA system antitoxin-like transcriptional regulator [Pseudonocardiaceae bacterium]
LRKVLVAADFNQNVMATKLGCTETRLSRIVKGKIEATPEEVAALLALCGVVGERRDFLVRMAHERSIAAWGKPEQSAVLRSLRWDATRIVEFSAVMVPELLWTDEYAEAVLSRTVGVELDEVPGLVGTINQDNAMLYRTKSPYYEVIVSEAALRLRMGSTQVMAGQLRKLVEESRRTGVTILVVPMTVDAHAGPRGSFALVNRRDLVVAAIEDVVSVRFVDDPDGVLAYVRIIDTLRARALTSTASRNLIKSILAECYGDRDSDHDPDESDSAGIAGDSPVETGEGSVWDRASAGVGGGR